MQKCPHWPPLKVVTVLYQSTVLVSIYIKQCYNVLYMYIGDLQSYDNVYEVWFMSNN